MKICQLAIKKSFPVGLSAIPFGIVMGTTAYNYQLTSFELFSMNNTVFAGASQLAFLNMYFNKTHIVIILLSCLLINSRIFLYSMAFHQEFKELSFLKRVLISVFIIDQTFVIYESGKKEMGERLKDKYSFFITSGIYMYTLWTLGVALGFYWGDIFPYREDLEFLVPLAFIGIFAPRLNNKLNIVVFSIAVVLSIVLSTLPLNLGLLVATFISMGAGVILSKTRNF